MSPIEIRQRFGLPRRKIAAAADVCEPSVRAFENNPESGVTPPIAAKLRPIYLDLEQRMIADGVSGVA